jgi:hypothetical protein
MTHFTSVCYMYVYVYVHVGCSIASQVEQWETRKQYGSGRSSIELCAHMIMHGPKKEYNEELAIESLHTHTSRLEVIRAHKLSV